MSSWTVSGHVGAAVFTVICRFEFCIMSNVVKLISKTIVVHRCKDSQKCCVTCYVDGKADAFHPPMDEAEALEIAKRIADGDDPRMRRPASMPIS